MVDNLAELLNRADIAAILQDFGHRTRQEDPVVHFYETFLGAYDPKMREARGVYYTPEPVVSYIVRSVDAVLKKFFNLRDGLADASQVDLKRPLKRGKNGKTTFETIKTHKVQILDPATGTGTFLQGVISQIYASFADNKGLWPGYVPEHLLPRLYGFELLMAPYAVAHMKLGLLLRETGYDFSSDQRLRVFLTNTLEEAHELTGLPLFTQWLAEEASSANRIKNDAPVMVVLGNPPYSGHSANTGAWMAGLLRGSDSISGQKTDNYFAVDGAPLGERNPKWLNDDYVKFIRFAQWRIEQTGYGVLAFVTNHGYLDNPTFRGMRQSLLHSFDDLYLLDLHGNSKKKEKAADGGKDENVFDIQQGVAIGIFVRRGKPYNKAVQVYHADLYGTRTDKYAALADSDLTRTTWQKLKPQAPFYLFVPQDEALRAEYEQGWKITEAMLVNVLGFQTHRDDFAIDFDRERLHQRITALRNNGLNDAEFAQRYNVQDNRDWKLSLARRKIRADTHWEEKIIQCAYRPFDMRWTYFDEVAMDYPRRELKEHVLGKENLCLNLVRQTRAEHWQHAVMTNKPAPAIFVEIKDGSTVFPLYFYKADLLDESASSQRHPNLAPAFIADFSARLQLDFVADGCGDLCQTFGPEDVFHYAYALFHSPNYRSRYADFLKIDFPRLPLTGDVALFRTLCVLGQELVGLHLMESFPAPETRYPVVGDNTVDTVRYSEPANGAPGRVWINATQYFDNVPPEVWNTHIGGYQVCQKWLKDRKGRQLSYPDLKHYPSIVAALARTLALQTAIDLAIGEWPFTSAKNSVVKTV
jgi:predicted helicase